MKKKVLVILVVLVSMLILTSVVSAAEVCTNCSSYNTFRHCTHGNSTHVKVSTHDVGEEECNIYEVYCNTELWCDNCSYNDVLGQHKCDEYHDEITCSDYGYDDYFCVGFLYL